MPAKENENLKKRLLSLSDEELLRIVITDYGDYREEALAIVREEARRRKLDSRPSADKQEKTESPVTPTAPVTPAGDVTPTVPVTSASDISGVLKTWFKYIVWTAIVVNIVVAGPLSRMEREWVDTEGQLYAFFLVLGVLLMYGSVIGSLVFWVKYLIVKQEKMLKEEPTIAYCVGLAIALLLMALIGWLFTLIVVLIYWLVKKLIKKKKPSEE